MDKEILNSPPRQRNSNTYIHTSIFNQGNERKNQLTPQKQSPNLQNATFKMPNKIRNTNTLKSSILKEENAGVQVEEKNTKRGLKTFKVPDKVFGDGGQIKIKKQLHNSNLIHDHNKHYFYHDNFKVEEQSSTVNYGYTPQVDNAKASVLKQEELYRSEVGKYILNANDGSQYKYHPRNKSINDSDMRKSFQNQSNQRYTSQEKRLFHNESNVLNDPDFQQKTLSVMNKKCVESEKQNKETKNFNKEKKVDSFYDPSIEHIKKRNHNFSELFGLEYGGKERLTKKRELSTDIDWMNIDSIRNRQDIGGCQSPSQARSRMMDQKSSLDTHNHYELNGDRKVVLLDDKISNRNKGQQDSREQITNKREQKK